MYKRQALTEYPDVTIKEETVEECTAEGGQKLDVYKRQEEKRLYYLELEKLCQKS